MMSQRCRHGSGGLAGDDATSHRGGIRRKTCLYAPISDQDTIGSRTRLAPGPDLWTISWVGHFRRDRGADLRGVPGPALSDTAIAGPAREDADGMGDLDMERHGWAAASARGGWRPAPPRPQCAILRSLSP